MLKKYFGRMSKWANLIVLIDECIFYLEIKMKCGARSVDVKSRPQVIIGAIILICMKWLRLKGIYKIKKIEMGDKARPISYLIKIKWIDQ